jgi:excisionase family DNA binding protein
MAVEQVERFGELVTLKEASRIKGCSTNTLFQWLMFNRIPHKKVGQVILVRETDLEAYTPRSYRK